ncbi:MAG: protein phosphatase CheZ [Alphaproteobacteria bacterium]|nr:protein phosphatase CheZ [Alphaproteobacteria bacterium]
MSATMEPAKISRLQDSHGFLDRVIGELRSVQSPQKDTLVAVLQYLSDHIRTTRSEIGALRGDQAGQQLFGSTADELEEIVTETGRAANRIMDAAEAVERVAATLDAAPQNALVDAVTNIYVATSFQDITGQRITKVVRALQDIETKLTSLMDAFGPPEASAIAAPAEAEGDERLLNGPQLEKNVSRQTDIDALFESLG